MDLEGINLKNEDCEMITGYFEGHDYTIETYENNLFIVDVSDETDVFKADFEEIVEMVYDWNNELIEDTEKEINSLYETLDQHQEFARLMSYLLELKNDSTNLNKLELALSSK